MSQVRRNGIALFYEEAGGGDLPLVFVHGWCCDHTYFAPQFEHFRRKHRVVTVDLRGHGQSDKPTQSYTMEAFADDMAGMCDQLGVEKPVVIGHSMGGIVAFDLACRYPTLPSAIVMLGPVFWAFWRRCVAQTTRKCSVSTWRTPCSSRPTINSVRSASEMTSLLPLSM
jgi:pimeloyl-ACP methyl ester carboxylesterase